MRALTNEGASLGKLSSKHVVSAGGVVFRRVNGGFEVALILLRNGWCLPKGLIEENETLEDAALREVREETGLDGVLVDKIGEISYNFFKDKRYFKTVHFYLFRHVGGSVDAHDSEVYGVRWFPITEALRVLTYVNEKKIMAKAMEMLKQAGRS